MSDERDLYGFTADVLTQRILALIPAHPEILTFTNAWQLFKVPGFECRDLEPSMAQADGTLAKAQAIYAQGDTSRPEHTFRPRGGQR